MPIDHYKMSIEAKPLYSFFSKSDSGSLVKIVRPLGSIRKARNTNLSTSKNDSLPKSTKLPAENEFKSLEKSPNLTISSKEDQTLQKSKSDLSAAEESLSAGEELPEMKRTKNKVFESRYKIAASRQAEAIKPAKLYNKRVVYLPMFRINVETYVGNVEDNIAVENTRQSLKKMIDNGRKRAKSPSKMTSASIKSYNFATPGREKDVNILDKATPRRLIQTERSFLSTPRKIKSDIFLTCDYDDCDDFSKDNSVNNSDDTDRMDVKFESLELNSLDDAIIQTEPDNRSELSKGNFSLKSSRSYVKGVERVDKGVAFQQLSDPYRQTRLSAHQQDQQKIGWPSYDDFRKMKQKIRLHKASQKQKGNAYKPLSNDVQKWVNIHYNKPKPLPVFNSQPNPTKLNPIIVPSHTCVECPMCNLVARNQSNPTSCPPNSPVLFGESSGCSHGSPDVQHSQQNPPQQSPLTYSSLTFRSNQSSRNEMSIPKVTVKILDSKQQLEEAKMSHSKLS